MFRGPDPLTPSLAGPTPQLNPAQGLTPPAPIPINYLMGLTAPALPGMATASSSMLTPPAMPPMSPLPTLPTLFNNPLFGVPGTIPQALGQLDWQNIERQRWDAMGKSLLAGQGIGSAAAVPVPPVPVRFGADQRNAMNAPVDAFMDRQVAPRLETLGRNAASAAIPLLTGAFTGAVGGSLFGGLGAIPGAIGGAAFGLGGALGAGALQNAVGPMVTGQSYWDQQQAREAQLNAQHPLWAAAGQVAPALLTGSPLNVGALMSGEEGALGNAAAQYGAGLGMEGVNQLMSGQFDPGRLFGMPLLNTLAAGGGSTELGAALHASGEAFGGQLAKSFQVLPPETQGGTILGSGLGGAQGALPLHFPTTTPDSPEWTVSASGVASKTSLPVDALKPSDNRYLFLPQDAEALAKYAHDNNLRIQNQFYSPSATGDYTPSNPDAPYWQRPENKIVLPGGVGIAQIDPNYGVITGSSGAPFATRLFRQGLPAGSVKGSDVPQNASITAYVLHPARNAFQETTPLRAYLQEIQQRVEDGQLDPHEIDLVVGHSAQKAGAPNITTLNDAINDLRNGGVELNTLAKRNEFVGTLSGDDIRSIAGHPGLDVAKGAVDYQGAGPYRTVAIGLQDPTKPMQTLPQMGLSANPDFNVGIPGLRLGDTANVPVFDLARQSIHDDFWHAIQSGNTDAIRKVVRSLDMFNRPSLEATPDLLARLAYPLERSQVGNGNGSTQNGGSPSTIPQEAIGNDSGGTGSAFRQGPQEGGAGNPGAAGDVGVPGGRSQPGNVEENAPGNGGPDPGTGASSTPTPEGVVPPKPTGTNPTNSPLGDQVGDIQLMGSLGPAGVLAHAFLSGITSKDPTGSTPIQNLLTVRKAMQMSPSSIFGRVLVENSVSELGNELARLPAAIGDAARVAAAKGLIGQVKVGQTTLGDILGGQRQVQGAFSRDFFDAARTAATQGVQQAKQILAQGHVPNDPLASGHNELTPGQAGMVDLNEYASKSPVMNALVNGIYRGISAQDRITRVFGYQRSLNEQATMLAQAEAQAAQQMGKPAVDVAARRAQLLASPTEAMHLQAIVDSEEATFQNDNAIASAWKSARDKFKDATAGNPALDTIGSVLFPFVKTPSNIIGRTLEYAVGAAYAPVKAGLQIKTEVQNQQRLQSAQDNLQTLLGKPSFGSATPEAWAQSKGLYDDTQAARAELKAAADAAASRAFGPEQQKAFAETFGRGMTGLGLVALGAYLNNHGILTGKNVADSDATDREKMQLPEGSIRVGDTWLNVSDMLPFGSLMALGATINEQNHKIDSASGRWSNPVLNTGASLINEVGSEPLIGGIASIKDLGQPNKLARFIGSLGSSFIPKGVREIAVSMDPLKRQIRPGIQGISDAFAQNIPGQGLPGWGLPGRETLWPRPAMNLKAGPAAFLPGEPVKGGPTTPYIFTK